MQGFSLGLSLLDRKAGRGIPKPVLRLLAVVAALSALLALTGWLEPGHCQDDHDHDAKGHPTVCMCLCHGAIAIVPDTIAAPLVFMEQRVAFCVKIIHRAQDVIIAIDPPPDKAI